MVHIGNDWDALLGPEFEKDYYRQLRRFLVHEYKTQVVYPDMHDIFNALKHTAYADVRAVILGQDPYHGPGQAHGLCFSVRGGVEPPPSLVNIFKEIHDELGVPVPLGGDLTPWARQGVLLLNTVLTVRRGEAGSHRGMGWETLTDRVISLLNERAEPMAFLLWGANAISKRPLIDAGRHLVLTSPHPSPLSAYRGFFGNGHFRKANEFLESQGKPPIQWGL
ncbi:MAG: uracil-DNA glycosylase [Clostridiales Family XIII bacterium]|jgi:uracil-DNA glycosylase|nr:uracil-DNA glycosylase [Clostridiales Family XIII bacterium]